MTGHPALAAFNALHRRLVRSRVLRDGSIGLAAGVCAIPLASGTAVAAALAAAGAAIGVAHGVLRAPRPPDAARLLDRRLGMADRLVTCLEISGAGDPMSQLVLDDAWEHLRGVSHAAIAPMRAAAAGARVAAALIVAVLAGAPQTISDLARLDRSDHAGVATEHGGHDPGEPGAEAAGAVSGGGTAGTPAERRTASGSDAASVLTADTTGRTPGGDGYLATTPGEGGGARAGRSDREAVSGANEGTGAAASAQAGSTHGLGEGMSTATPAAAALPAAPDEALREGTHDVAAAARVEAALERARVPPGLRRYVMSYFLAIAQ